MFNGVLLTVFARSGLLTGILLSQALQEADPSSQWFDSTGRILLTIGALFLIAGLVLGKMGIISSIFNPDSRYGLGNALPVFGIFILGLFVYLDTQNGWPYIERLLNFIYWMIPGVPPPGA
jgi:hypothetical protein